MNIAIIPARGGSKRIPRKNIKEFCGIPMIAYAINAAKKSGLFEHVVVSTDDDEIAEISKRFGAEVPFKRPVCLSDDYTGTVPVVAHAIRACADLGLDARHVCCIYPAVPLININDLQLSSSILDKDPCLQYVMPVTTFPSAIQRALKLLPNGALTPFYPEYVNARSQDLELGYYDAGQFYFGKVEAWLGGLSLHQNSRSLVIPEWRVSDIDNNDDWLRAERLFNLIKNGDLNEHYKD